MNPNETNQNPQSQPINPFHPPFLLHEQAFCFYRINFFFVSALKLTLNFSLVFIIAFC